MKFQKKMLQIIEKYKIRKFYPGNSLSYLARLCRPISMYFSRGGGLRQRRLDGVVAFGATTARRN